MRGLGAPALAVLAALGCGQPEAAVREAGEPTLRSPELDETLFRALPELVIAVNEETADAEAAGHRLLEACPAPSRICLRLAELSSALRIAAAADAEHLGDASWVLAMARRRLNRALAAADAAYTIDSDVLDRDGQRVILVMSFEVARVLTFAADGRRYAALQVRRRDGLNWSYQLLGFTNVWSDEALVLEDTVDADLLALFSTDDAVSESRRRALQAELGDADLADLHDAVRSYRREWNQLSDAAEVRALVSLGAPTSLPAPDEVRQLAREVLDAEALEGFETAHDRLLEHPALAQVRRHQLRRTAIHEVQHLIDQRQGTDVQLAVTDDTLMRDEIGAELSAYLAEMAHSPSSARSSLARLADFAHRGSPPEADASRLILDALGTELDLPGLEASGLRPAAIDENDLARAARVSWRRFFGRELVAVRATR